MKNIRLVIIDLDDTIYSEYDFVQSGFKALAEILSKLTNLKISFLIQKMNEFYSKNKKNVFDQLIYLLKLNDILSVKKSIEIYKYHTPEIKPFNDFFSFFKKLVEQNIDLILLTDGDVQQQKNKVNALGIKDYFKSIYYSDSYGLEFRKPNPKIYLEILRDYKFSFNEVLVIGDNPYKDFHCKKSLGIKTIQVKRPNAIYANSNQYLEQVYPEQIVYSLNDISLN